MQNKVSVSKRAKAFFKAVFGTSKGDIVFNAVLYFIFVLFLAIMVAPLVYVIAQSLVSQKLVDGSPTKVWSFAAYQSVLGGSASILRAFGNTVVAVVLGTLLGVAITMLGAYPLSKHNLRGRTFFLNYVLITMLFSGGLIPFYTLIRNVLHLTDSFLVYIVVGGVGAFNVFIAKGYLQGISNEIYEAAILDGAGEFRIFFSIYLPLSKPIIATIALWIAVGKWNDYMTGLLYIKSTDKLLIQNILRSMLVKASNTSGMGTSSDLMALSESIKMAAVVISLIPIMCIYPFVQKYFAKGVMLGSVKG